MSLLVTKQFILRIRTFGIVFLAMLLLQSCATTGGDTKSPVDNGDNTAGKGSYTLSASDKERFQEGIDAMANGDTGNAKSIFTDLTDEYPGFAEAYCNLAIIAFNTQDYDSSLELVNTAISNSDKIAQAFNIKGQINVIKGKIKQAKEDYERAIAIYPDYAIAHYNLALLYDVYFQDIENAVKHYETYLSLLKGPDEKTQEWVNHLKGSMNNANS